MAHVSRRSFVSSAGVSILFLLTVAPLVAATADDCDPGPLIMVTGSASTDPALVAKDVATMKNYLSAELIQVLRGAAANSVTWDRAMRNPTAFLTEKGFPPPANVSVNLLMGASDIPASGPGVVWDPSAPSGCTLSGTVPVTTTEFVLVCDRSIRIFVCHTAPDGTVWCGWEWHCLSGYHAKLKETTVCVLADAVALGSH
jgi:hypothetical protein